MRIDGVKRDRLLGVVVEQGQQAACLYILAHVDPGFVGNPFACYRPLAGNGRVVGHAIALYLDLQRLVAIKKAPLIEQALFEIKQEAIVSSQLGR